MRAGGLVRLMVDEVFSRQCSRATVIALHCVFITDCIISFPLCVFIFTSANYVEPYTLSEASSEPLSSLPTPQRNLPPAYNTAVASSSVDRVYAPVKARWTSGSSIPTSPPAEKAGSQVQTQQQGGGGATAAAPGPGPAGLQPADSEEEKKKQDKLKKLGGKVGTAAAGG